MKCDKCGNTMIARGFAGDGEGNYRALYGCLRCNSVEAGQVIYQDSDAFQTTRPPNLYMGSDGYLRPLSTTWRDAIDALPLDDE